VIVEETVEEEVAKEDVAVAAKEAIKEKKNPKIIKGLQSR